MKTLPKSDKKSQKTRSRTVREVVDFLEARTPGATAEKWDNVGLLVGDAEWKTSAAVVSVDLTREAIEAAKRMRARLIVNHHPCIFPRGRGPSSVTAKGSASLVFEAIRAGIAVVATHTNFDQCALEVPRAVSAALGVVPQGRLHADGEPALVKLVVFVPKTHAAKVAQALFAAGAGQVGNYDECAFQSEGQGSFRGLAGSDPFIGKAGKREHAKEIRFETIFPRGLKKAVLTALRASHPYEEIAYDLYRVEQSPSARGLVSGLGYGFYGDFDKPLPAEEALARVAEAFGVGGYLVTEPLPKKIRRIGFVAGKGSSFIGSAAAQGCDLFITGEAGYHDAREGALRGVAVMELGHRESERFFLRTATAWMEGLGLKTRLLDLPIQSVRSAAVRVKNPSV